MKKDQDKIAITQLGRAGKLANAGIKVGSNYAKHFAKKLVRQSSQESLDEANAKDIYKTLSELKGGPLKMAQMLSLGDQLLPKAYTEEFSKAQSRVTPLSYALIRKTFKKEVGINPEEVFDNFSKNAVNAASIGQVHKGTIKGIDYAIKVQYPGVADSLQSDINLVAPFAIKLLGLNKKEIEPYLKEVKSKLLEETNYMQERENGRRIIEGCDSIDGLVFPRFKKKWSGERVLTMTWLDGLSLTDWVKTNPAQNKRNQVGQILWDFYQHQIHTLRLVHADPHPGNFIITRDTKLGVIDFGCVKELPSNFYKNYLKLLENGHQTDSQDFIDSLVKLELYNPKAPKKERALILNTFPEMFELVGRPLMRDRFDFGDNDYFAEIFKKGEALSRDSDMRGLSTQGSKHFIYFNRTYFGLYQLLNQLKAEIDTSVQRRSVMLRKSA